MGVGSIWRLCALSACVLVATPASASITAYASIEDTRNLAGDEARYWKSSDEQDEALANVGAMLGDAALDAYLQGIMDRLFPEFAGLMRVRVLRSPVPNAFMMANGSCYVNAGMLAILHNEAQIAAVLGHEGGHFVDKHVLRGQRSAKGKLVFGQLVALAGVPLVGEIFAISSISGFSRDLERKADEYGRDRLATAGYAAREGSRSFQALLAYYQANETKERIFWASHPALQERIDFFSETQEGGELEQDRYLAATRSARTLVIDTELENRKHKVLVHLLDREDAGLRFGGGARLHLAEGLRLRGQAGDADRARALLEALVAEAPSDPRPHRALGEMHLRAGDRVRAAEHFERFLELGPDAPDRNFVEHYLKMINP